MNPNKGEEKQSAAEAREALAIGMTNLAGAS
jgi:hypothetical protein